MSRRCEAKRMMAVAAGFTSELHLSKVTALFKVRRDNNMEEAKKFLAKRPAPVAFDTEAVFKELQDFRTRMETTRLSNFFRIVLM